ncbi:hypothetical protein ACQ4PT_005626 [Festuca glaucescens]
MQAKKSRAATIAALCMLLLMLSGQQQQVAAMSKFCRCYRQCYPECRHTAPRLACDFFCLNKCSPNKARDSGASYCRAACGLDSICGSPVKPAADPEACVRDCNQKRSHN